MNITKILLITIVLVCCYLRFAQANEDYYKILGVNKNADESEIKRAFKKLSLKYHPDKNRDNEEHAKKQFVKVAQAYETLIDPEKRKTYDQFGEEGVKRQEQGQHPGGGGGGFPGGDFQDIFNSFFGGFQGGGGRFHFNMGGGHHGGHHHGHHHGHPQEEPHEDLWAQSDVYQLTMGNIGAFYRRNEVWLILFYKSNDRTAKSYRDAYREIAEKLYGIVKVAAVNCHQDAEEALCEDFMAYDTPKILVFPANIRSEPLTYSGSIQYGPIAAFAVNQMESFVKLVTENNYNDYIQEDFDKTKVILFTSKKTTPPLLKALSKDFKGRIVFGEIRETSTNLVNKFHITNFPTLLVLGDAATHTGVAYQGEYKKDQIAKFLRDHSSATSTKRTARGTGNLKELLPNMVRSGPCSPSDSNICLLAILDNHEREKSDRLKNILEQIAPQYSNDPIGFFFIPSANIEYTSSFEDVNSLPSLFILKTKRGRYVQYTGDIAAEGVQTFVESVLSGTATFKGLKSDLILSTHRYNDEL